MIRSPGLVLNLLRVLGTSSFYPSIHCVSRPSANDRPKGITLMDAVDSSREEIHRITSLPSSSANTGPHGEGDYDGTSDSAANEFGNGERMVINYEENSNCSDQPVVEEIVDSTNETNHRFRLKFLLPKTMRRFLTRKEAHLQLMREMHTMIKIPHSRKKDGDIVITGCNETNVVTTYRKIKEMYPDGRRELGPTHFVSIPMNAPNIQERYEVFQEQVLERCASDLETINRQLFSSPQKLHLTLCVLSLMSETDKDIACRKLNECQKSVIEPLLKSQALTVRMRGIDIMNNDPTKVRILYANVESTDNIIQRLADDVAAFYTSNNSSSKGRNNQDLVKLHVTLMNTKFVRDKKGRMNRKLRFNATDILKNFKEFDFGEVTVNCMHLSQMCSLSKNEYYLSSNIIQWA